jgi:hypothetical protein
MQISSEASLNAVQASVAAVRNTAIDVVDYLLTAHGVARGHEVDLLLDLRGAFSRRENAEEALDLFCRVRVLMEQRHYVGFYRLRRWLEANIEARVRVNGQCAERLATISLNRYCLEAIRSGCVLSARQPGEPLHYSRVGFFFKREAQ